MKSSKIEETKSPAISGSKKNLEINKEQSLSEENEIQTDSTTRKPPPPPKPVPPPPKKNFSHN